MTASEAAMKAELLRLRMEHPELVNAFIRSRDALWRSEERMDRLKLDIAAQHKGSDGKGNGQ